MRTNAALRGRIAVLVLAAAIGIGGCARLGQAQPRAAPPGAVELVRTIPALCEVTARMAQSVAMARAVFFDKAHDDLHELARIVQTRDRDAAARLVQAKDVVERDFWYRENWPRLTRDLPALTEATRGALTALGLSPPACDPRSFPPV